jgi:hypothetical protein
MELMEEGRVLPNGTARRVVEASQLAQREKGEELPTSK